jgi:GNAT superfamily N-acetyltransferase
VAPRPPMTIRAARVEDGPVLQEIERRAGERFRDAGLDAVADDGPAPLGVLAAYAAAGRAWVAVDAGSHPVGYVLVDEVDGNAHVEQVSVVPDHQGRGVGRALVDHVRAWAVATGMPAVTLTTFTDVAWNAPLYRHLGFRVLADHEIGPGLRRRFEAEAASGLDPALRVCMGAAATAR